MKRFAAVLIAAAASAHAQLAVMHTNGVVTSPNNLTIQQSNVAGLASALDSKLGTNPTLAISNTAGLQSALDGKLATNGTLAVSNVSGLQSALDGKLATNGSAAALTNFPSSLLSQSNGIINYTNTNVLSFTKGIEIKGPDTTNIPTLFWETSDGVGDGSMLAFSRRHATNLWGGVDQTNWSQFIIGQNVAPTSDGNDYTVKSQTLGSVNLVMENMWQSPVVSSPVSETYFVTIDTNGLRTRNFFIMGSQTNSDIGGIEMKYPLVLTAKSNSIFWYGGNPQAAATISSDQEFLLTALNNASGATVGRIMFGAGNSGITAVRSGPSFSDARHFAIGLTAYRITTNGVIIGSSDAQASAQQPVHLAGNTRIDGAITFDNTTNAATTRTNLGLGSGITTNVSSGTLQFSNGILVGHTP